MFPVNDGLTGDKGVNMTAIEVLNYRPINKGIVKCSFNLKIVPWGLTLRDCAFMEKENNSWISFPSRRYEENGETKYFSYVFFEKEVNERLNAAVKEKLRELMKAQEPKPPALLDEDIPF